MEQLTQNLKDGAMELLEVPLPAPAPGRVLVRNHFSAISAGTEGKTVKDARLGYIGKARARKEEVKKVIETAKKQGLMKTYRLVMNKLNAPSPLGYSCAGEVIAVGPDVREFKVGDLVACGGGTANHAEVVSIPKNLCAKIAPGVPLEHAAFTTVAAIALQGIRQADLRLGENCVVIGLGLIGQLTIQFLKAAGIQAIGIDIAAAPVETAKKIGADLALERSREDLEETIIDATRGHGTDAVIITAGTSSTDPIELAGRLCRKKGKVIIVGAVPTGFTRKNYYRKELDLRMSSSYGPGRYDADYEEKGIDYPIGYVRWTEQRNMQAFLDLLAEGKINMDDLLTHTFTFEQAPDAYQMIVDRSEPFLGIALKYDVDKPLSPLVNLEEKTKKGGKGIGFIGAGSFAQNFLLPNLKEKANLTAVATSRPHSARKVADKFGFGIATGDAAEVLSHSDTDTVFIATRHDTHGSYVLKALEAGKHVFVEKPLCLEEEELETIKSTVSGSDLKVMVGFNRRFAPMVEKVKAFLPEEAPKTLHFRINAGNLPGDHWVHDPKVGGGRILGEACHFIDLAVFLAGSPIQSVTARALDNGRNLLDTVVIQLGFENKSIASITYCSQGNSNLSKEYYEVFCQGTTAILDDFQSLTLYGKTVKKEKASSQDKGHRKEVELFLESLNRGGSGPISFAECYHSMLATFKVMESIRQNGTTIYL